jgi:ABC-type Na+ efflux pump permease subunit
MTKLELYIIAALVALLLGGGGFVYVRHLEGELRDTKAALVSAHQQSTVNQAGAAINDRRAANVAHATHKAEEGRDAVQNAPDLDAALSEFGAALDGVRAAGSQPVAAPH